MCNNFEDWLNRKENPKPRNYRERILAGVQKKKMKMERCPDCFGTGQMHDIKTGVIYTKDKCELCKGSGEIPKLSSFHTKHRKPLRPRKRMKQVSDKNRTRLKKYAEEKALYLADHPICEVQLTEKLGLFVNLQTTQDYKGYHLADCTYWSTQIHHKARRGKIRCNVCEGVGNVDFNGYPYTPTVRELESTISSPILDCEFCRGTGTIDFLTDKRWFLACCSACHKFLEENGRFSIKHGFTIARAEINKIGLV